VALYREKVKGMDTSEICNLIKHVFKPDKHYSFPKPVAEVLDIIGSARAFIR
jgi:hypothetical protein